MKILNVKRCAKRPSAMLRVLMLHSVPTRGHSAASLLEICHWNKLQPADTTNPRLI